MKIVLECKDKKYQMHYIEYALVLEKEGNKIIKSIEENLGLKFNEEEVKIDICEGYQDKGNFSGSSIKDIWFLDIIIDANVVHFIMN